MTEAKVVQRVPTSPRIVRARPIPFTCIFGQIFKKINDFNQKYGCFSHFRAIFRIFFKYSGVAFSKIITNIQPPLTRVGTPAVSQISPPLTREGDLGPGNVQVGGHLFLGMGGNLTLIKLMVFLLKFHGYPTLGLQIIIILR